MIQEEIFINTQGPDGMTGAGRRRKKVLGVIRMIVLLGILFACMWKVYEVYWLRHRYLLTAYCDCPICINVPEFRDGKFASRKPVYWGGVAADKSVPFGSNVELLPVTPRDWFSVKSFLSDRRYFTVEDRGGKIRGRHIDIFFPQSMGGHEIATHWGVRRMRVKINGRLMD